ncbi:hypothetical protein JOC55_005300 [Paenibacillus sacheonensis]|nr:hypothetical protein [Paenibacillus sacheonensis]
MLPKLLTNLLPKTLTQPEVLIVPKMTPSAGLTNLSSVIRQKILNGGAAEAKND